MKNQNVNKAKKLNSFIVTAILALSVMTVALPSIRAQQAFFEVTITDVDDSVVEGEDVTVNYNVTNTGDANDTQSIVFYVDGVEKDNKTDVLLEPGEYVNDTFTYTTKENDAPEIEVNVSTDDDTKSVIVTVQKEHTLTVEEPTGEGTLIVDGNVLEDADYDPTYTKTFLNGTTVELEAVAEEGYHFVNWTGDTDNIDDPEDNQTTIKMEDNYTISAVFTIDTYNLTIDIEGEGSTEPGKGNHTYYYGENVTVKAIPAEGWGFVNWTGDYEGTEEEINITMDENKSITAHFAEIPTYQLTVEIEGKGQVEINPEQEQYEENTEVNLTAISEEEWYFKEWTGDYEGTEKEITITMDSDKTINAVFIAYEAFFEVKITSYDRNVKEGEYVTVQFRVRNLGEAADTQDIVLRVGGLEEDRKEDVTLEPGEEYTDKFFWMADEGSYLLRVSSDDDDDTVPITVEGDQPVPGFTTVLLMIAGVIAVAIYQKKKR